MVRDKDEFAKHWNPDVEKWFEDGVETEGLVMLKIGRPEATIGMAAMTGEVKF